MNDEHNLPAVEIIDMWFNSGAWKQICKEADDEDQDSVDLMDEINENLRSLLFHLSNGSGNNRIDYEMKYFQQLCYDFDVNKYE